MKSTLGTTSGLVRLGYLIQETYSEVGRACDLTVAQAQLLCTLADRPHRMAELTGLLGLERSSLTGLVDRATQRGFVVRSSQPDDRRAVVVTLTPEGAKAADTFHDLLTERLEALLADLPAAERDRFVKTMSRVVADAPAVFHD